METVASAFRDKIGDAGPRRQGRYCLDPRTKQAILPNAGTTVGFYIINAGG